jgi:hypothetical protein
LKAQGKIFMKHWNFVQPYSWWLTDNEKDFEHQYLVEEKTTQQTDGGSSEEDDEVEEKHI